MYHWEFDYDKANTQYEATKNAADLLTNAASYLRSEIGEFPGRFIEGGTAGVVGFKNLSPSNLKKYVDAINSTTSDSRAVEFINEIMNTQSSSFTKATTCDQTCRKNLACLLSSAS